MISLSRNPFKWDEGGIGKALAGEVIAVKFQSNEGDIAVKNLSIGEEIILSIPTPTNRIVSKIDHSI